MAGRAIALSGELGSGKSEVSARVARALGARRVSTGEAQRAIAEKRGISTLDLNHLAETDPTIDDEIDGVFRALAATPRPLVVDSRLAWHFLPMSYKVHLVVDPRAGASRVLHRTGSHAEHYESLDQALTGMGQRVESERRRFQQIYGVDIFRLDNYDLVVDTTDASPEEVTEAILTRCTGASPAPGRPFLLLSPGRIGVAAPTDGDGEVGDGEVGDGEVDDGEVDGDHDGEGGETGDGDLGRLEEEIRSHGFSRLAPVVVDYRRPEFTVVDGRRRLLAAARCGVGLVPAVLADGAGNDPDVPAR
jgi:CMP/dCMP kinase